jgi:SAM-dependent methyltransferase
VGAIVGRDGEMTAVEQLLGGGADGPAVLALWDEAGVGKTTVWEAGVAARRGMDRAPGARSNALDGKYALDTAQPGEKQRLDEQAKLWDPLSFRQLASLGVADGWRCLEVGGGTGTVARWLSERVGRTGQVVGTDLVTRWMDDVRAPSLQVRRHDIVVDPLEESTYDLVHARLVLTHLPQRDAIVTKLIGALKPGGWLLLEDADSQNFGVCHPPHALWAHVAAAILGALDSAGADHE